MNKMHYDIGFGWGVAACQKKAIRVPAADVHIMNFIKHNCKKPGSSVSLTKGWLDGYLWQVDHDMKLAGF